MGFLLALPTWMKVAIGSLAVIGILQIRHHFEIRGKNRQIEKLTAALDHEKAANAELTAGIETQKASVEKLEGSIKAQNAQIEGMRAQAQADKAAADARVLRVIREGQAIADALRAKIPPPEAPRIPPGHAAMNAWLKMRLQ